MKKLRFILIGGFLGAGKTTTMARLARHYMETRPSRRPRHQRPGARAGGHQQPAGAGLRYRRSGRRLFLLSFRRSCRQGRSAARRRTAGRDSRRAGRQLHRSRRHGRAAAPRSLRRPLRGRPVSRAVQAESRAAHPANETGTGFSPKAAYIFRKQLEEADAIVINRIDEMSPAELQGIDRING